MAFIDTERAVRKMPSSPERAAWTALIAWGYGAAPLPSVELLRAGGIDDDDIQRYVFLDGRPLVVAELKMG